jgi:hypothetical protein
VGFVDNIGERIQRNKKDQLYTNAIHAAIRIIIVEIHFISPPPPLVATIVQ